MDIKYRKAIEKDVLDIFYVESQCFKSPWSLESIRHDICENECAVYLVAQDEERIIGFCAVHVILDEGHIMNLAVLEKYRGFRIGETLLKKMFSLTRPQAVNFTLEVRVSNAPAIRLYERLGFKCFGMRRGYYEDTGESAMIMWLNTDTARTE